MSRPLLRDRARALQAKIEEDREISRMAETPVDKLEGVELELRRLRLALYEIGSELLSELENLRRAMPL